MRPRALRFGLLYRPDSLDRQGGAVRNTYHRLFGRERSSGGNRVPVKDNLAARMLAPFANDDTGT